MEVKVVQRTIDKKVYVADDGTEFDHAIDALKHEFKKTSILVYVVYRDRYGYREGIEVFRSEEKAREMIANDYKYEEHIVGYREFLVDEIIKKTSGYSLESFNDKRLRVVENILSELIEKDK